MTIDVGSSMSQEDTSIVKVKLKFAKAIKNEAFSRLIESFTNSIGGISEP